MGIEDDWSYIRTTQVLANTGHIVYNGWATAMLGLQVYWGALFVKLFGFSFSSVRFSVLALAMLSAVLFYRCLVRVGLTEKNATLGTLALVFCPVWFSISFNFMSDIPGTFGILVCLYACLRALQSSGENAAIGWLVLASIAGMAGGTCRQTTSLAALVMVPSAAWLLRGRRYIRATGILLFLISAFFVVACLHWFHQQPYTIPESLWGAPLNLSSVVNVAVSFVRGGLTMPLFLLPILIGFLPLFPFRNRRIVLAASIFAALCLVIGLAQYHRGKLLVWLTPYSKNYVSAVGFVDVPILVGTRPIVLHTGVRVLLTALSFAAAFSCAAFLAVRVAAGRRTSAPDRRSISTPDRRSVSIPDRRSPAPAMSTGMSWSTLAVLIGPFSLAYVLLLTPRSARGALLDRYLLPLIALCILVLIRLFQEYVPARLALSVRTLCFATVIVFALYDVAAMHDLYALYRARIAAANEPLSAGVPRAQIGGGFEYDDWTELLISGYVNDERLQRPAGAYHPPLRSRQDDPCSNEKADLYPDVVPSYILSFDPRACLGPSRFAPVTYRNWLTRRPTTIYVLRAGDRTQTAQR